MAVISERDDFKFLITGTFLLAINAGYIAAVTFNNFNSTAVSHMTGNVVRNAAFIALGDFLKALQFFILIISFVVGSAFATSIVSGTRRFDLKKPYGMALMVESLILLGAYLTGDHRSYVSDCLASLACGFQNAMCTSYSGAVLRTTHLTGVLTDIGIGIKKFGFNLSYWSGI
jgi:uncharacterized membrane protein YoaK (UPF0700 family)